MQDCCLWRRDGQDACTSSKVIADHTGVIVVQTLLLQCLTDTYSEEGLVL